MIELAQQFGVDLPVPPTFNQTFRIIQGGGIEFGVKSSSGHFISDSVLIVQLMLDHLISLVEQEASSHIPAIASARLSPSEEVVNHNDQFGGPKDKKFMNKKFKQVLIDIQYLPADEKVKVLDKTLVEWQGKIKQVDDVLIIGVCFN